MAYGDKRDYPKREIYLNGVYVGTTTWARTNAIAARRWEECHPARNHELNGPYKVTARRV